MKLSNLPLPPAGYYFQQNGFDNIVSLSLLSNTHRIIMNTGVENTFYVFNREVGIYMKYTRCATLNLYTYVVGISKESEVLLHSIVEGKGYKFSTSTRLVLKQCTNHRK